jgi:hypothetical protein
MARTLVSFLRRAQAKDLAPFDDDLLLESFIEEEFAAMYDAPDENRRGTGQRGAGRAAAAAAAARSWTCNLISPSVTLILDIYL